MIVFKGTRHDFIRDPSLFLRGGGGGGQSGRILGWVMTFLMS